MIAIQPRKTILKLEYNDTDISGDISERLHFHQGIGGV